MTPFSISIDVRGSGTAWQCLGGRSFGDNPVQATGHLIRAVSGVTEEREMRGRLISDITLGLSKLL